MSESEGRILGTRWNPPEESEVPDPKAEARRRRLLAEVTHLPVDEKSIPPRESRSAVQGRKSGKPRGRRKSGQIRMLEKVLRQIERHLPDGGTLPEVCERLKDAGQRYEVPATPKRAAHYIEYPDAIQIEQHYEVIRHRISRILGSKLLPRSARTGQNKS